MPYGHIFDAFGEEHTVAFLSFKAIIGDQFGRISLDSPERGTTEEFPARSVQALGEFKKGEKVLIVKIQGTIAYVSK